MATKHTSKKKPAAASRTTKSVKSASSKPLVRKAVATPAKAKVASPASKRSPSKGNVQETSQRATLLAYAFTLLALIFLGAVYYAYT